MLGLWSILITDVYYLGFVLIWREPFYPIYYPLSVCLGMAGLGFLGGCCGMLSSIFQSLLFAKLFFFWAVIRFFSQFAEGIIYAAEGYKEYVVFFILFIIWGYYIIVVNQYIQILLKKKLNPRRLIPHNYQSTIPLG